MCIFTYMYDFRIWKASFSLLGKYKSRDQRPETEAIFMDQSLQASKWYLKC